MNWKSRAFIKAGMRVRRLRFFIDKEVTGWYDANNKQVRGLLFRLQIWLFKKGRV